VCRILTGGLYTPRRGCTNITGPHVRDQAVRR